MEAITVTRVPPRAFSALIPQLAAMMQHAINVENLSFNYLSPVSVDTAAEWWRNIVPQITAGEMILFVAHAEGAEAVVEEARVLGCIMLGLYVKPNARHRADVLKMMVATEARRRGVASRLLTALEAHAKSMGRTLLLLDTEKGTPAEAFYAKCGFVKLGEVPQYILVPDQSRVNDEVFFYKHLE